MNHIMLDIETMGDDCLNQIEYCHKIYKTLKNER